MFSECKAVRVSSGRSSHMYDFWLINKYGWYYLEEKSQVIWCLWWRAHRLLLGNDIVMVEGLISAL